MTCPPFIWHRVVFGGGVLVFLLHVVLGALAWGVGAMKQNEFLAHCTGAALGVALIWVLFALVLFCRWLRKKQTEGDT